MGPVGTDPSTHVSCTPQSKLLSRFIWRNLAVAPRLTRRVFPGCLIRQQCYLEEVADTPVPRLTADGIEA